MFGKCRNALVQYWREIRLNPLPGMWSMVLQRITGLGIVFYLLMHMTVVGSVMGGAEGFDEAMGKVQGPPVLFKPFEFVLMVALLFHGLNGLRITVLDFAGLSKHNKLSVAVMAGVFVPLAAIGGWIFLTHIVHHG